jgi:hypothetical protein
LAVAGKSVEFQENTLLTFELIKKLLFNQILHLWCNKNLKNAWNSCSTKLLLHDLFDKPVGLPGKPVDLSAKKHN